MRGVLPLAQSFDTVGWMTREVALLRRVAEVLIPRSACDAAGLSGCIYWPDEILSGTTSDVSQAISTWIAHLALAIRGKSDLSLHSVALDACLGPRMRGEGCDRLSDWLATYRVIQAFEAWRNHGSWIASHWDILGENVRSRFKMAQNTTEKEYEAACERMAYWRSNVREVLQRNVLLVPSTSSVAPKISGSETGSRIIDQVRTSTMRLTCIAGLSGLPAVNIPLRTEDGLPCGLSVIGPAGSDIKLISFARELSALVK